MSRLLVILSVVLVGAALVVVMGTPLTRGEGAGRPAHAQTTRAGDRFSVDNGTAMPGEPSTAPGRPRSLIIDSLGIRAPVVPLKTHGSTLYPPVNATKVGWWRGGAMPGAVRGSAVVTGHTVSNGEGVFDNLARLRTGDGVRLVTDKGVLRYVVRAEASYRRTTLAQRASRLFSQSSAGRLVLVTCEGWNGEVYLRNHVVIAMPA